jgi:acyl carrier protein phosphodiesterase
MNHLAHALLSGRDTDIVLGGWLGDFVRGRPDPALPKGVRDGIALHRAIDTFTDAHTDVAAARALFDVPFRRYAGILVDVWFDHLLARDFMRWSASPLATFAETQEQLLERHHASLPAELQRFARYMRMHGLPAAYADRAMISRVFAGIASRFRRENPLADGLEAIAPHEAELATRFASFFPSLREFAADRRDALVASATAGPAPLS